MSTEKFLEENNPAYVRQNVDVGVGIPAPKGTKRFIFTAAQNATPVVKEWWAILKAMSAQPATILRVAPLRYKNPTSRFTASQQNADWWAPDVRPYLFNRRLKINKNLMFLGDIPPQSTVADPLTGVDVISRDSSGIVPAMKLQLRSIAAPAGRMAKIVCTTGACTEANYTRTVLGKKAEFHHSLSAIIVELEGPRFHMRVVSYNEKTQSCIDLDKEWIYSKRNVVIAPAPRPLALCMGDTHVDFVDPGVVKATFSKGGIIDTLKPRHLIWADLLDGYSCNPHHKGDPFIAYAKRLSGRDIIMAEVGRAIAFVRKHTPADTLSIIQASNHNDFLTRYVKATPWQEDAGNALFLSETSTEMLRNCKMGPGGTEYPDAFGLWFKAANVPGSHVLSLDEQFVLADVVLHMHGDKGVNGARGSLRGLRRVASKGIIEHSHILGVEEGWWQAATSTRLRLEYNHGASSWSNAHILLDAHGKRQWIIIVDGHWRG
jgi:hypothetical protein